MRALSSRTRNYYTELLLNARTQHIFDQTDDGVDAEMSLSLSLSLHFYLSSPPLHFFPRAHNRSLFSLKMRVSSKELFSTLKTHVELPQQTFRDG